MRPLPAPKLRWIDRFVNVNGMPRTPSMRNGKARFWNAAGILAGSRSKPASMLNHSFARRVVERDVVEVAVEEDVLAAPVEQRTRLVFPGAAHLPVARRAPPATPPSFRNRRAAAERQLVAGHPGQAPWARVVAPLPERRLAVVLLDGAVVAHRGWRLNDRKPLSPLLNRRFTCTSSECDFDAPSGRLE